MEHLKEKDQLEERKEIMQDVIDRHIKYGDKYIKALNKLNEKFPTKMVEKRSEVYPGVVIRSYKE